MKNITRILLAGTTLALSATALADAPVRITTEGLPTHMRQQLEAAAQQGPVAPFAQAGRRAISTALVPPKAKELDMTAEIPGAARAVPGT